jgi:nucleoid-associated protein YgaU
VVKERDTLDWIAYDEYGDTAMWRFIAETNNLDNPQRLTPGQVLAIAPPP